MKCYLLDTNICIAILKKDPNVAKAISQIDFYQCYISEITVIELKVGAVLGKAKAPHGKYVDQHVGSFIDNLTVIPIGASIDLPTTLLW